MSTRRWRPCGHAAWPPRRTFASFGRRLRALRKLRMFTQEKLGERAGVSGKLVGQIQTRRRNSTSTSSRGSPPASSMFALARTSPPVPRRSGRGRRRSCPPGAFAAAERVSRYLARRPAGEVRARPAHPRGGPRRARTGQVRRVARRPSSVAISPRPMLLGRDDERRERALEERRLLRRRRGRRRARRAARRRARAARAG